MKSVREAYDRKLRELQDKMYTMAAKVEDQIRTAVESLKHLDVDLARQVIARDTEIDRLQYQIEEEALILIATQQPLAGDLREISAIMAIAGELERMADYAEGIARIAIRSAKWPLLKPLIDIPRMMEHAIYMMHKALEAFRDRDPGKARELQKDDDFVDELYNQIYRELLTFMLEDPRTITRATYLLWAAHNLERLADRTTNIGERVIFMVTGQMPQLNDGTAAATRELEEEIDIDFDG